MSLENTLKYSSDIMEMDLENRSGQAGGYVENATLDLIKEEYINENSDIKIEEHSIEEEDFYFKNDKDSCHSRHGVINVKDEEISNTHISTKVPE